MSRHGLYQPKIADAHIRTLYQWAKRFDVPMTHLLNTLVEHALVRLDISFAIFHPWGYSTYASATATLTPVR